MKAKLIKNDDQMIFPVDFNFLKTTIIRSIKSDYTEFSKLSLIANLFLFNNLCEGCAEPQDEQEDDPQVRRQAEVR